MSDLNIELHVKMNMKTGAIEVSGPLDLKPLCCKALAAAINAVIDHTPPVLKQGIPPNLRPQNGTNGILIKPN